MLPRQGDVTVMRGRLFGIALGAAICFGPPPSVADWLEPRSSAHCNMRNASYPFQPRLDELRSRSNQCVANAPLWPQGWRQDSACGTYEMSNQGPAACAPIERQICETNREMKRLQDQCLDRLEDRRQREAAEKKRQQEQERAERAAAEDRKRFLVEAGRNQGHQEGVFEALRQGQQLPLEVSDRLRRAMGRPGPTGAELLSRAFIREGTSRMQDIQAEGLRRFEQAMGGVEIDQSNARGRYTASTPRRSQSQIDRTLDMFGGEAERFDARADQLRFGGYSVVAGAYANIVTQIVEATAQGHIDTPLAAIGLAVATWVAWEAAQAEMEMKRKEQKRRDDAVATLLPLQQAAAKTVEEELRRQRLQVIEPSSDPMNASAANNSRVTSAELEQAAAARRRMAGTAAIHNGFRWSIRKTAVGVTVQSFRSAAPRSSHS